MKENQVFLSGVQCDSLTDRNTYHISVPERISLKCNNFKGYSLRIFKDVSVLSQVSTDCETIGATLSVHVN